MRILVALFACCFATTLARADKLPVYCWQGKGTGSNLLNKAFTPKWKAVLNDGSGTTVEIDDKPTADVILEKIASATIVYTNSHSGVPKGSDAQGMQVGEKGTNQYVLSAPDVAAKKPTKPQLVIINGCSTMPLLPEKDGNVKNLATGFGIAPGMKGRAFIGFHKVHSGAKGDDFFRVFFYFWSGVGAGKDHPTLKEAADMAVTYINEQVAKMGGDEAQKYLLSKAAAAVRADMEIVGDEDLRYTDLKP